MRGIDLNKPIIYKHSSLRFFEKNERHINRICEEDVLLLVYEGTLCFSENGNEYEVPAGHYHIQQHSSKQIGYKPSDSPKYLYIHFWANWIESDNDGILNYCGDFDYLLFKDFIENLDQYSHDGYTLAEQTAIFYNILSSLYRNQLSTHKGDDIAEFIREHYNENISLELLSNKFKYSKNQIINIFKNNFSQTPISYLNKIRIKKARHLLEVTSNTTESISELCGFQSYSHFFRLFIRENGISPTEWRKSRRAKIN